MKNKQVINHIQNKYGNTALMVAAKNGYIGYVKLLLQKNANMGITNCNEETCLELLCDCDHIWDMEKKKIVFKFVINL